MNHYQRGSIMAGFVFAPVIVVLIGIMGLTALAWAGPEEIDFYRKQATRATERSDWQASIFALETLTTFEPHNNTLQWDLAMAFKKAGNTSTFEVLCAELAPLERPGFGPAQRFTAAHLLEKLERSPPQEPAAQDVLLRHIIGHLRQSLVDQPGHVEGAERLADLLLATEDYAGALTVMNTVPSKLMTSSLKVRMAWLADREKADTTLDTITSLASGLEAAAARPDAQDPVRRAHGNSTELRRNIAASASIWLRLFHASRAEFRIKEARRHLARLHTRRADDFFNRIPRDYSGMAEAVYRGLAINPTDPALLERLVKLANPSDNLLAGPEDQTTRAKAQTRLGEMLAQGTAPSLLHLLLGMEYHKAKRHDLARLHFELSHRADPRSMEIANNLAWYLAHSTPRDPERALILANAAIQQQPDRANYLETRGQVLALLGLYTEAITDLEKAERLMGSTRAIHITLAQCYKQVGETALANHHLVLASRAK